MKTIYNTYVKMTSQKQCDRMKQLCIDNSLPIWNVDYSFEFFHEKEVFGFDTKAFFVMDKTKYDNLKTEVTEEEFIELIKTTK